LTVQTGPSEEGAPRPVVPLQNASADFEQTTHAEAHPCKGWNAASVIDPDEKGRDWGWSISPQEGRSRQLLDEPVEPLTPAGESTTRLTFRLDQNLQIVPNFTLGRFRLWATTASHPLTVDPIMKLPDDIQEILTVSESERSAEQQDKLATYYRSIS